MSDKISQTLNYYTRCIDALHKEWKPHPGQIKVGQALFKDSYSSVFVQCGRKWGKTELIEYMLWRVAMMVPGSTCYYISPFFKQSKELIWANKRIQNFGPREWVLSFNNSELRINFNNGSFIKLDGSDNYDAYRGVQPHLLVMEEFKDHRPEFMEAMRPNLSVYNAPCVYIGTPPEDAENHFLKEAEEHKKDPQKFFYHAPTWENPHISKSWLDHEKQRLYDRGEGDVWEREYGARFVRGGANKIFSMLSHNMVYSHQSLLDEVHRDKRKLEWFLWADPAAASVFAVLFGAYNPYSKIWYFFDEIYETTQSEMTVQKIGKRIFQIRDELFSYRFKEWRQGYDEAETWFQSEMLDHFEEYFEPTRKMKTDKISGISLIKDIMLQNKLKISDRCKKLYWELDIYRKDKDGKIPKKNDHLIDCFRYILAASSYDTIRQQELMEEKKPNRGYRIEDDFPGFSETGEYMGSELEKYD